MAGIAIGEATALEVQHAIKGGDKLIRLQALRQQLVHLAKDRADGVVISDLCAQEGAETGHDERGGDAFADHIGHHNAQMPVYNRNEIEVIAADPFRGNVNASEVQTWNLRNGCREEAQLDLARDPQLLFQSLFLNQSVIGDSPGN